MHSLSVYTPRCFIRVPRQSDAPLMHAALKTSFTELKKWMPWAQHLASLRDTEYFIYETIKTWQNPLQEHVERPLIVMDVQDTQFIGATGITPLNLLVPSFEIGYWIDQRLSGQGLMTEAINGLAHYLFQVQAAKRLEIHCEVDNQKSVKLAERLHFLLEARMINQRMSADGKSVADNLLYAMTNPAQLPTIEITDE